MLEIFLVPLGLILGLVLAYLYMMRADARVKSERASTEEKLKNLLLENQEHQKDKNAWIEQSVSLKKDREILQKELETQKRMYEDKLSAQKEYYEDKIQERKEHFETIEKKSRDVFENIAHKIFTESGEKSTKNISQILEPFKKEIDHFRKAVDGQEKILHDKITTFTNVNSQMRDEAHKLTQALKGDIKTQGNWGEVVLENILEKSGLTKGEDFFPQAKGLKLKSDQSSLLKPDAVVKLPENKCFVIDSKVSFANYQEYIDSNTEEHLKKFLNSVSAHIDNLSSKKYEFAENIKTSGWTLMFIPNEGMFSLAVQSKKNLFEKAWEKGVVLVGPTTLIATLRTVHSIWKIEKQNKYTQEIAKQGRLLFEKFAGFLEDMAKIDTGLKTARDSYEKAVDKIKYGNRSLMERSSRLAALGNKMEQKEKTRKQKKQRTGKPEKTKEGASPEEEAQAVGAAPSQNSPVPASVPTEELELKQNGETGLTQDFQKLTALGIKPKKDIPEFFKGDGGGGESRPQNLPEK